MSRTALHGRTALCLLAVLCAAAAAPLVAQGAEAGLAAPPDPIRERLDAIREHLVSLRFENALAAVDALLGQPALAQADRAEALVLRAQAHVAFGDLDAAERDFEQILRVRPDYVPAASLTPAKAMKRFDRVRARLIGSLRLEIDPPEATLLVDGRAASAAAEPLPLVVGKHRVRAEAPGFDPQETEIEIRAAEEASLQMRLVPNARTVVLRTEPDGVAVTLDGVPVGTTRRPESDPGQPAELVLEHVELGEHVFGLTRDCYRPQRIQDLLTVDLLDRSPRRYPLVELRPAGTEVQLRGGPEGADVFVDGKAAGRLPLEPQRLCPGLREIEVRLRQRVLWHSRETLSDGVPRTLDLEPRPNALLIGAADWPVQAAGFASAFNRGGLAPGALGGDLSDPRAWSRLDLPRDADLVLALTNESGAGARERWLLYSPHLRRVQALELPLEAPGRPAWRRPVWGVSVVDSAGGGPARVILARAGGPAARAGLAVGDRIVAVGGRAVLGADEVRLTLAAAVADRPLEVEWIAGDGARRRAPWTADWSPRLEPFAGNAVQAAVAAAWAVVDALVDPANASAALANLALLQSEHGDSGDALESWTRVRWAERQGVGAGTVQYYLGRELERAGREAEAVAAYRRAAASSATAFDDEGPAVAPAARDRLADLGVDPR